MEKNMEEKISLFDKKVDKKNIFKYLFLTFLLWCLFLFILFFLIMIALTYVLPVLAAATFKLSGLNTFTLDVGSFGSYVVPMFFLLSIIYLLYKFLIGMLYDKIKNVRLNQRKKYIKY